MEWQKNVLADALKVDENNNWIRTTTGIIVARQQGKSHLVRMRSLAGLLFFNEAQQYYIAQNRRLSLDHLWKVVDMMDSQSWIRKRLKKTSRTNGSESIEVWCEHYPYECPTAKCHRIRRLGILAATADGARGASGDFLWVDELREISETVWSAASPITRARSNPTTWISSNAGDMTSTVLNDLRNRALADDNDRLGWYEWSAPQGCRIDDPEAVAQANPALGHTVQWSALEDSIARDHPDTVRTELLCQWVTALDSPFNLEQFDAGTDRTLVLDPTLPTWMGLDLTFNRSEAYLVTAQQTDDSLRVFLHRWEREGPINERELALDLATLAKQYKPKYIAYDPNTAGFVAPHLKRMGIPMQDTPWSSAYFATLCDVTMTTIDSGRIKHTGQPELRAHLAASARRPASDGGWRIARRAATAPIGAAVAMVLAVGHAEVPRTQFSAKVL